MKKIIILAYDFPPHNSVGAQRPYSWYKYFKKFELYPIIVTRNWNANSEKLILNENLEGKIYYTPFKLNFRDKLLKKYGKKKHIFLRRFLSLSILILQFFSKKFDNKSTIYDFAKEIINEEEIDFIIATGEPFILFKYAYKLSKSYKIPWFADYRDGWTSNYSLNHSNLFTKHLNKNFVKYFEKKYVKSAKEIFTVSNDLAKKIELISNKKVKIIKNGFFEEQFISEIKQSSSFFNIIYAGSIYPYQRIDIFLEGFKKFVLESTKNVKLTFYGTFNESNYNIIDSIIANYIEFNPRIPHIEIILYPKC